MVRQLNFKRIVLAFVLALGLLAPSLGYTGAQTANHNAPTQATKWCWRCAEG